MTLEAGKFNNTAVITCNETENKTNNSTEVDVLYVELAINKTADPSTVYVGQEITFTIAYANNGNGTAHNATVTDEIDTDVFKIISYGDGTLDGNVITWKVGDLLSTTLRLLPVMRPKTKPITVPLLLYYLMFL